MGAVLCGGAESAELREWPREGSFLADCTELIPQRGHNKLRVLQGLWSMELKASSPQFSSRSLPGAIFFSAAKSADIKLGSGMVSFLANRTDLRTQGKQLQPCVSVVANLMADSPRCMSASCWTPSCTEGKELRDQEEQ